MIDEIRLCRAAAIGLSNRRCLGAGWVVFVNGILNLSAEFVSLRRPKAGTTRRMARHNKIVRPQHTRFEYLYISFDLSAHIGNYRSIHMDIHTYIHIYICTYIYIYIYSVTPCE